jgi:hypothetical protein
LNSFPFLYELYYGDLKLHRRPLERGDFYFGQRRDLATLSDGLAGYNCTRSFYFTPVTGYGWLLDEWMAAGLMHINRDDKLPYTNVYGLRTMWAEGDDISGDGFRAKCPEEKFRFAVRVEPGKYRVWAEVGDRTAASNQRVSFNEVDAGVYILEGGSFVRTEEKVVQAPKGLLTVGLEFVDDNRVAIHRLLFERQE